MQPTFHRLIPTALALALAWVALATGPAQAGQIKFAGAHPIPAEIALELEMELEADGDGYCYIEVPHVHVYEPAHADVLYREHDDHYHFVGDPVAHQYDGPTHTYYGHHPVQIDASVYIDVEAPAVEYCYLDGPHFHHYPPPPDFQFELKGEAFFYIGKYPRDYRRHKKKYVSINVIYQPIVYLRPKVVVAPPKGYLGPVVDVDVDVDVNVAAPAAARVKAPPRPRTEVRAGAGVEVRAGVEVNIPIPSVEIGVSVPGVVVHRQHKKHRRHKKHRKHKKHKKHKKHRKHRRHRWRD